MHDGDFLVRSTEISRIEGLSDAVFGFAITLLIVSLEVPKTALEVLHVMRGFVAFGVTFAILFMIWRTQFKFFRRYGLEDNTTVWLTAVLLFTVLLFAYPMKYFFGVAVGRVMWRLGVAENWMWIPGIGQLPVRPSLSEPGMPALQTVYGIGWVVLFGVFFLLYRHAYDKRDELKLNPVELFDTREAMAGAGFSALGGVIISASSAVSLWFGQRADDAVGYGGLLAVALMVVGIVRHRRTRGSRRQQAVAEMTTKTEAVTA